MRGEGSIHALAAPAQLPRRIEANTRMTLVPVNAGERERFVDDLLAYMTPLEKAGQLVLLPDAPDPGQRRELHADGGFFDRLRAGLVCAVGGVESRAQADALQRIAIEESRLGIPLLFAAETGSGIDTIMPAPAAAAASWDSEAIEAAERAIAGEARAHGINWALGPDIRLLADSAHSDYAQSSGAAGFLAGQIAAARVRGLQHRPDGAEDTDSALVACLGLTENTGRRNTGVSAAAEIALDAIRQGQVGSIAIDIASPSHAPERAAAPHPALDLLRRPGGYHGMLLSDWAEFAALAGQEPLAGGIHGLSPQRLVQAIRDGKIDQARVDDAVRRVLATKFDLGLFRSPFRQAPEAASEPAARPQPAREAALDLARKSIVLLRNDPPLLPLGGDSRDVLVVGAAAGDRALALGGRQGSAASLIDGLEQLGVPFKYVPGLALRHDGRVGDTLIDADRMAIGMACEAARRARTVIVVLGEAMQGARYNALGEAQRLLLSAIHAVNERIVLVTLGARPLNPAIAGQPLACVLHAGLLGTMSGHAIAQVLTGEYGPTGRLPAALEARDSARSLPFGYGRGYGDIACANFTLESGTDHLLAALELRNLGELAGTETIQLYVRRCDGAQAMATGELRGFARVELRAGERGSARFEIGGGQLARHAADGRFVIEEGRYEIQLGPNRVRLHGEEIEVSAGLAAAMRGTLAAPGAWRRAAPGLRRA